MNNTVPSGGLFRAYCWVCAQWWAVQRFSLVLLDCAKLVISAHACCDRCVGLNIGSCNNCIEK